MFLPLAFLLAVAPTFALPRLESAPCAIEVAPDERIECSMLVVPENREKADSRPIRLPVMRFRSRSAAPAAEPLIFMPGGPGNSNIAGRRLGKGLPFLADRDYILLEQRGTRYAQPALECPPINRLKVEIAAGRLHGKAATVALVSAAAACRKALVASGADLDGYTTAATADDLEDLRRLLGIARWNLYGFSYSTRLMLTALRRHPAGVRSAILDSVLPPDVNFDEVAAANLLRALDLVFAGCAVDRDCGKAFPSLRQQLAELVARSDRKPLALDVAAEVRGAQVIGAIYSALHDPDAIATIPRIISSAAHGHYDELVPLVKGNQGPSSYAWGLRLSIWCGEEMPFENPQRVASQVASALGLGGIDEGTATPELCRAWNVKSALAVENEPVHSDVPTLIFAGEFDPDTPPDWGRQLLETMPNAKFVELRGRSHGAAFSRCGGEIAMAFLRNPSTALPVDRALKSRGADFGVAAR